MNADAGRDTAGPGNGTPRGRGASRGGDRRRHRPRSARHPPTHRRHRRRADRRPVRRARCARARREQLAVYEDRDPIARDLHDLVVQRLLATETMLESTRRRAGAGAPDALLGRAVDELDSTIQEVRTTIFALQQPPADATTTFRGRVLHETRGAAAPLGFSPSVHFSGAVDSPVREPVGGELLTALRGAPAAARRRREVSSITVHVDATAQPADGRQGVRLTVTDGGLSDDDGERGTTLTWHRPL